MRLIGPIAGCEAAFTFRLGFSRLPAEPPTIGFPRIRYSGPPTCGTLVERPAPSSNGPDTQQSGILGARRTPGARQNPGSLTEPREPDNSADRTEHRSRRQRGHRKKERHCAESPDCSDRRGNGQDRETAPELRR